MAKFVGMARVWSHMSLMKGVEARSGVTPEVIISVWNKGPTRTTGIVKEAIVAPIAVIQGAVIAVIIAVVVHRPAWAGAPCQCEQRGSGQSRFQCVLHEYLPDPDIRRINFGCHNIGTPCVVPDKLGRGIVRDQRFQARDHSVYRNGPMLPLTLFLKSTNSVTSSARFMIQRT